eukprot:12180-Chlamydomonas_euryale.AAC.2
MITCWFSNSRAQQPHTPSHGQRVKVEGYSYSERAQEPVTHVQTSIHTTRPVTWIPHMLYMLLPTVGSGGYEEASLCSHQGNMAAGLHQ